MKIGLHKEDGHVHHRDENITNNIAGNLEIIHPGCHVRLHKGGVPFTAEHRARIGKSMEGNQNALGNKLSAESREKISRARRASL